MHLSPVMSNTSHLLLALHSLKKKGLRELQSHQLDSGGTWRWMADKAKNTGFNRPRWTLKSLDLSLRSMLRLSSRSTQLGCSFQSPPALKPPNPAEIKPTQCGFRPRPRTGLTWTYDPIIAVALNLEVADHGTTREAAGPARPPSQIPAVVAT